VKGGADRLEVCANLANGGGTTPTLGLVRTIYNLVDLPLMVRERFGILSICTNFPFFLRL
jgi:copper homeostasis protein